MGQCHCNSLWDDSRHLHPQTRNTGSLSMLVAAGEILFQNRSSCKATRIASKRTLYDLPLVVDGLTTSLQTIHGYTGLPWWAFIPITTFSIRAAITLPLAIIQRKRIAKQSKLRPLVSATTPVLKLNLAKKCKRLKRK